MKTLRYFRQAWPSTILFIILTVFTVIYFIRHNPANKILLIATAYTFYTIMAFGQTADRIKELKGGKS